MKTILINEIVYADACDKCGKHQVMHHVGKIDLCCYCYIKEGNTPADWHSVCMSEYKKLITNKA